MNPDELINQLGWDANALPAGWSIAPARSSSKGEGTGWRVYTLSGGNIQIRWSPGSLLPDHSNDPYWTVSSGQFGETAGYGKSALGPAIDAGSWDQPPYATPGSSSSGGSQCVQGNDGTQTVSCIWDPFPLDLLGQTTGSGGPNGPCGPAKLTYVV
jgi:hypothetical protein